MGQNSTPRTSPDVLKHGTPVASSRSDYLPRENNYTQKQQQKHAPEEVEWTPVARRCWARGRIIVCADAPVTLFDQKGFASSIHELRVQGRIQLYIAAVIPTGQNRTDSGLTEVCMPQGEV